MKKVRTTSIASFEGNGKSFKLWSKWVKRMRSSLRITDNEDSSVARISYDAYPRSLLRIILPQSIGKPVVAATWELTSENAMFPLIILAHK